MFYLFHRSREQDFKSIVKQFSLDNPQANDRRVVQFAKSVLFNARGLVTRVACNVTCPEDKLNAVFVTVIK